MKLASEGIDDVRVISGKVPLASTVVRSRRMALIRSSV